MRNLSIQIHLDIEEAQLDMVLTLIYWQFLGHFKQVSESGYI